MHLSDSRRGLFVRQTVFKVDLNFNVKPFINDLMNATGLAFDRDGMMYVSSRYEGFVYQVTPTGNMSVFVVAAVYTISCIASLWPMQMPAVQQAEGSAAD